MNTPIPVTNTGCLLVVDDQESNIQVVGAALGRLGFEILPATGGPQAFQRLAVRRPDIILLDLLMPEMDGFEVCRRIRENLDWAEIPIVFLSSADDKGLIVRALESGGVDYITKPFNHAELVTRVRTHLALKRARDELKQLAEDRDELLGILTHDLKNYLGGMDMSAQLLRDRTEAMADPKLRLMAENISHSSRQMLAFVRGFLANASADHGLSLKLGPTCLKQAASRAVQLHQEAAWRKQLVFHTAIEGDAALVQADLAALSQVLDNLLSNAIKFSPPGKQIRVTVSPPGASYVECHVQDEGPGFTAEDKTRMFRRYARLSARPTGGEPSTGLGLSIVKKLVLAMQGELVCESTPGNGTTFTFRLPRTIGKHLLLMKKTIPRSNSPATQLPKCLTGNRVLYVLKARGMAHSNQIREFLISDHGIDLVDAYIGASGVLTGSARAAQGALEKAAVLAAQQEAAQLKREVERKRASLERQISGLRSDYETEALELRRIAEQVGTRTFVLGTERAASGLLRQADIKVAASTRGKPKPGRGN